MTENDQPKEHNVDASQIGIKVLILNSKDEVLLLKRNPDAYGDGESYWDIPGGRAQKDVDIASIIDTGVVHPELNRELQEEIGWTPESNQSLVYVAQQQIVTSKKINVNRYTFALRIHDDIQVRLSPEHTDHKWTPVDELKNTANLGSALKALVLENKISPKL